MEKKMIVADFAELVGTTPKTIYGKINNYDNLPVIERLHTVNEKVKGREIRLIVTNTEQIEYYQNLYGKNTVIDGEYYETVTDNDGIKPVNEFQSVEHITHTEHRQQTYTDQLLTLNNYFNDRIEQKNTELMKVYNELSEVKGKQLLLEDKAGREGLLLNEIREIKEANNKEVEALKKENNRNRLYNKVLTAIITILLLFITYNIAVNKSAVQVEEKVEQAVVQVPAQPTPVQVTQSTPPQPAKKR